MTDIPRPILDKLHRTQPYNAIAGAWSEPVGLACSGGVDSTAMLLLAAWARRKGRVAPFVVMHVDHRTRPETRCEQQWLRRLAATLEAPFVALKVPERVANRSGSPEEVLREARYRSLSRAVMAVGATSLVTAHTRDDQVETVLMRLISGASALGLAGMERQSALPFGGEGLRVLRPLLDTSRGELQAVLEAASIEPFEDPTNLDPAFRRNAIRMQVVPALKSVEPRFDIPLMRSVELAARDAEVCDALADAAYQEHVEAQRGEITVDRAFLKSGAAAITSRVLRRIAVELAGELSREVTFERVEAVRVAASGRTGALIELPGGVVARVERERLRFSQRTDAGAE